MRFSVIVPVRDGAATIGRAIASCLAQDWTDFEVVVVDNGSTDGTAELVRAVHDPRVRLIQLAQPGRSVARNAGLDAAHGEVVVFLDADDELPFDKLSGCARAFRDDVDALQGATLFISEDGTRSTALPYAGPDFYQRLLVRNSIPINSMAVRRSVCSRFPVGVEHCEDWAFWLDTLREKRVSVHADVDSIVHVRQGSTSADVATMRSFELPIFSKFAGEKLAPRWAIRRAVRRLRAATDYAGIPPHDYVENALQSSALHQLTQALRAHDRLRRALDMALRVAMRGAT